MARHAAHPPLIEDACEAESASDCCFTMLTGHDVVVRTGRNRCCYRDIGSHAAAGDDTRATTTAGASSPGTRDVLRQSRGCIYRRA
jgi:hypothetical protein